MMKGRQMKIRAAIALLMTAPLLFACSDNSSTNVDITMQSVAGTYYANSAKSGSKLELLQGGTTRNALAEGFTILLALKADGTTSGSLYVPPTGTQAESNESLIGTWTLAGSTVNLSHATDTLLRDITFTVAGNRLSGSLNTTTSVATVVLVK
jgi:hypothetical protein